MVIDFRSESKTNVGQDMLGMFWICVILKKHHLVGGLEHEFIFPYIGNVIIPADFHIFQSGWNQPVIILPSGKLT